MKSINRSVATTLVEQSLQAYRKISPNMPEEIIVGVKDIPYGWYFKIGLKNPSCGKLYYGAYTDYIVDRDYRFLHIANNLEAESEIEYYGTKRKSWVYRQWWRLSAFAKSLLIKSQVFAKKL